MLPLKKGVCPDCAENGYTSPKPLIKGYCKIHYLKRNRAEAYHKNKDSGLYQRDNSLIEWYRYHIAHSGVICENCHQPIDTSSERALFSSQAHILPKAHFPSVKTHLANHLTLCSQYTKNNCHGRFDSSWEAAKKMDIIGVARQKIKTFIHFLNQEEMRRFPFHDNSMTIVFSKVVDNEQDTRRALVGTSDTPLFILNLHKNG